MSEIIKVEKLNKIYYQGKNEIQVLNDITFSVNKGEFVSIMGPSGSGKSTLLYLLGGLEQPTSGCVLFADRDINQMKDKEKSRIRREKIGFVFQFFNLVQNLTVEENILLPLAIDRKNIKNYKLKFDEILSIVGLTDKRKEVPSKLSGGEQQRVAIARAVITQPEVILADEPIGNLDSVNGTEVMKLFKQINQEKGITIVQVTHSEYSAQFGNRLIVMKDGMISSDATL